MNAKQAKASAPKAQKAPKTSPKHTAHGVGRRKASVARAWLKRGNGSITVNGKDFSVYFDTEVNRLEAATTFRMVPAAAHYDVDINVYGGGVSAQAGAVKLATARALVEQDETLRPLLRSHNLLTVDSRVKERKKYGQKAARRKFQFVKR